MGTESVQTSSWANGSETSQPLLTQSNVTGETLTIRYTSCLLATSKIQAHWTIFNDWTSNGEHIQRKFRGGNTVSPPRSEKGAVQLNLTTVTLLNSSNAHQRTWQHDPSITSSGKQQTGWRRNIHDDRTKERDGRSVTLPRIAPKNLHLLIEILDGTAEIKYYK